MPLTNDPNPDPGGPKTVDTGGPKTCGSGFGSGSATLPVMIKIDANLDSYCRILVAVRTPGPLFLKFLKIL